MSDTADGSHQFLLEWIVHFCPQTSHHHIDDICVDGEINVPDLVCDFVARHDFTGAPDQVGQEQELLSREMERSARPTRLMLARINLQIVYPQMRARLFD